MMYHQLLCIVGKNEAEPLMGIAKQAGSTGGTIFSARGTANSSILAFLCLGDCRKEILMTVVEDQKSKDVFEALTGNPHIQGICISIPCSRTFIKRNAKVAEGVSTMDTDWELIQVICKSGYADDVMATARKAGAGGGTILDGRGTSKPDDETFFGASLVPEKEMLMILVEKAKAEKVFTSIVTLPCMQQPGNGIAFSLPVEKFATLGEKTK
jgi:nitrogen regulatory protein PII